MAGYLLCKKSEFNNDEQHILGADELAYPRAFERTSSTQVPSAFNAPTSFHSPSPDTQPLTPLELREQVQTQFSDD